VSNGDVQSAAGDMRSIELPWVKPDARSNVYSGMRSKQAALRQFRHLHSCAIKII
jgi:hypothetical protein